MAEVRSDLIEWLKSTFKLNQYEASAWLALLEKGETTAGEISKQSGVPRSRIYDILVSLEKKGFVIPKLVYPIKYVAVNPLTVIEILKKKLEIEYAEKILALEKLKETKEFKTLVEIYNMSLSTMLSEPTYLKGRSKIYSTIKDLFEKLADKKIVIVSETEEIYYILIVLKEAIVKKTKENPEFKVILVGNNIDESQVNIIIPQKNVEIKNISENVGRFVIIDEDVAFLFLRDYYDVTDPDMDSVILVKFEQIVKPLLKLVENKGQK